MRIFLACLVLAAGCGVSIEDFNALVEDARACQAGDTCVLAGGGQCTCNSPVNASRAVEIDEAAEDVRCGGAMVECPSWTAVRCEAGRCVADRL